MGRDQRTTSSSSGLWNRLWTTRRGNWTVSVVLALSAVLILLLFHTRVISITGILPPCLFRVVTGFRCMGCGGTRSIQCFLRGDWGESFYYNPLFFLAALTAVILYMIFTINALRPHYHPLHIRIKRYQIILLAVFAVMFLVVRNTPWYQAILY